MTLESAVELVRNATYLALLVGAPVLIVSIAVGLAISVLQAVTQIQEQTLVFVPKIVASFVVLLLVLPFVGAAMSGLMTDIANRIAAY